jgi:hypothetical protein
LVVLRLPAEAGITAMGEDSSSRLVQDERHGDDQAVEVRAWPTIRPLRPPAGAPNVLVVLLDDVGFGASSALGGPCHTPTAERLAADGL